MNRYLILAGAAALAACGGKPSQHGNETLPPVRYLSSDSSNNMGAFFSPDGSHVYWWQPSGSGFDLWMADTTFANAKQLPVSTVISGNIEAWSADGSQLVVAVADTGTGVSALMVMSPDGSNARRLSVPGSLVVPVSWHTDNDGLDYLATAGGAYQSFATSVKRGGVHPLIPGETRAYFGVRSPDDRRIAYVVIDRGLATVWIADSDGTHKRQVSTDGFESFPTSNRVWSPDGKWIEYMSNRTGTSDVWIAPADSGPPKQLTHDVRNDYAPQWSPDGRWIAFLSDRGHQIDLWVAPVAGGPELRVTDDTLDEEAPQWRGGTKQLAYLTGQGSSGVWRLSVADGTESRLTPDSIYAGSPLLSPDGSQVAFRISRNGGNGDIAIMPVAGGPMRIAFSGGSTSEFAWSPDGSKLSVVSDRAGSPDVWLVDLATSKITQLVNWPGNDHNATWSADGASIYFLSDHESSLADVGRVPVAGGAPARITTSGSINNIAARPGVPGLYVGLIQKDGLFHTARLDADGKTTELWNKGNTFPLDVLPSGDSLVIGEIRKTGGMGFRLVPAKMGGDGTELVKPGDSPQSFSKDGKILFYSTPNGATTDIVMMNRVDGSVKRLTTTPASETAPAITPDGKYVVFRRYVDVRRVAVADLTKMLGKP